MNIFALISKIIGHFLFVIIFIFFSTLQAKEYKKFSKADFVADYFSGILLLNQSKYNDSYKYLRKLDGLEEKHPTFSSKYLYSLPVVVFKKRNGEILLEHVDETIDNLRRLGFGVELHGPGWGFANLHK